ncbi:hypothetical protein FRC01_000971 [Tulasnella sp. 417]|nr:hypothetical protein FRC01_000971 [Tulasnella sp. 417]
MTHYNSTGDSSTFRLHQQPEDIPSRSQPTTLDPLTATLTVLSGGSPNYHLPVELLTFILILLFPDTGDRSKNDMAEIYRLRLVSKLWKELIEGAPTLWTDVSLAYPPDVVRDCLRWSKNQPLQISITDTWSYPMEALIEFLQLLQPQSHRWKTLSYHTSGRPNLDRVRIRHFLESPAPMLQSLHLRPDELGGDPRVNFAGGVAKELKHFSLAYASLSECSDLLHGLETLILDGVDTGPAEELLSIFVRSPALRRFEFWNLEEDQSSATTSVISSLDLVANSLEEVVIQVSDPRFITLILSQVSMPNCKSLELSADFSELGDDFPGRILDDALAQFIPRIREALSLGGVARFFINFGSFPEHGENSLEIEGFQFSFTWSGITTESLSEWIRELLVMLDFPLELEIILSTPDRLAVEALGEWNQFNVRNLWIRLAGHELDLMENAISVLDFLGDVLVDQDGGLSWNFPNLQELNLYSTQFIQFDLSRLFNMLNKRYLPDAYVKDMGELGITIQTPPRIDLRQWKGIGV